MVKILGWIIIWKTEELYLEFLRDFHGTGKRNRDEVDYYGK
jgi:hypothetical protein